MTTATPIPVVSVAGNGPLGANKGCAKSNAEEFACPCLASSSTRLTVFGSLAQKASRLSLQIHFKNLMSDAKPSKGQNCMVKLSLSLATKKQSSSSAS
jgi:hypothetical protein